MRVAWNFKLWDYENTVIFNLRVDRTETDDILPNEAEMTKILEEFVIPRLKTGKTNFKAEVAGYQTKSTLLEMLKGLDD